MLSLDKHWCRNSCSKIGLATSQEETYTRVILHCTHICETACIVTINGMWLFLMVPWVRLQYVIVVFPDQTHFLNTTHIQLNVGSHGTDMLFLLLKNAKDSSYSSAMLYDTGIGKHTKTFEGKDVEHRKAYKLCLSQLPISKGNLN